MVCFLTSAAVTLDFGDLTSDSLTLIANKCVAAIANSKTRHLVHFAEKNDVKFGRKPSYHGIGIAAAAALPPFRPPWASTAPLPFGVYSPFAVCPPRPVPPPPPVRGATDATSLLLLRPPKTTPPERSAGRGPGDAVRLETSDGDDDDDDAPFRREERGRDGRAAPSSSRRRLAVETFSMKTNMAARDSSESHWSRKSFRRLSSMGSAWTSGRAASRLLRACSLWGTALRKVRGTNAAA